MSQFPQLLTCTYARTHSRLTLRSAAEVTFSDTATPAPRAGSPQPSCTGTALTPPFLHRDCAHPTISAPGLGLNLSHPLFPCRVHGPAHLCPLRTPTRVQQVTSVARMNAASSGGLSITISGLAFGTACNINWLQHATCNMQHELGRPADHHFVPSLGAVGFAHGKGRDARADLDGYHVAYAV